jgi:hypothetical protein
VQSSQNDTKLVHQLIKRQRRNNHCIDKMIDEYDDTEGILEGWWSYFTDLFGNSDQGNFDTEKLYQYNDCFFFVFLSTGEQAWCHSVRTAQSFPHGLFFVKYMLSAVHFSAVFLL